MKKSSFISALSIGVLSISMAFANPAAVAQVRENAVQVLKILNKANGKNDAQIRKQAEDYVTPYFDFERMTALAVGAPWNKATPQQKKALIEGFKNMIRSKYTGTMMKFKNAKVVVHDKTISNSKGNEIQVNTSLATEHGTPMNVSFVTYKSGNRFRVFNVLVEGGSLVTAYRQQFTETINTKGIDGLIQELNSKGKK